ncbi:hypothetical protein F0562_026234 [Nyssa sinensis]|uniref:Uncharacterized protein n=1 Tax=Nyssa sinensis TaxID=561372 RepID=A0A5J5BCB7_9ASTE|nr:hypothetical protein F0562_026234 [Nyssa sinensis]
MRRFCERLWLGEGDIYGRVALRWRLFRWLRLPISVTLFFTPKTNPISHFSSTHVLPFISPQTHLQTPQNLSPPEENHVEISLEKLFIPPETNISSENIALSTGGGGDAAGGGDVAGGVGLDGGGEDAGGGGDATGGGDVVLVDGGDSAGGGDVVLVDGGDVRVGNAPGGVDDIVSPTLLLFLRLDL